MPLLVPIPWSPMWHTVFQPPLFHSTTTPAPEFFLPLLSGIVTRIEFSPTSTSLFSVGKDLVTEFGFDGVDIDIEHGINAGGTFSQPTGDSAVLANILNNLHADLPNFIITLTPQVANISATSGFDQTWGNYASLILQTYIAHLKPSQIVIGYPAPNSQGGSDGAPATPTSTIKRAIQYLRTATASPNSCGTYVPPKAYPGIGGVFNWEVTYDQNNSFKFAKDLVACIIQGNCQ